MSKKHFLLGLLVLCVLLGICPLVQSFVNPFTPSQQESSQTAKHPHHKRHHSEKIETPVPAQNTSASQTLLQQIASVSDPSREKVDTFLLPILTYHYIRDYTDSTDPTGISLSVSPQNFERQLQWLSDHNFETVNPGYFTYPYKTDKKPIILTFDDGYQDAYDEALPLLLKYHFQGTFYIITSKVQTPGYLTWNEIREMEKAGMTIGSHTINHIPLTIASDEDAQKEIAGSKKILEEKLGMEVQDFCYPFGKWDQTDADFVKAAGYKTATTTNRNINTEKNNVYKLKRINSRNDSDFDTFPELNK